jgi:hypothetical protein
VNARRGYSLIGLLMTLACTAVLLAITLPSMRSATTGMNADGTQSPNSAWGGVELIQLQSLGQAMLTHGLGSGMDSMYPRPSDASGTKDRTLDTTANLYSLLVMERFTIPKQLVRKGDRGSVEVDTDYDWTTYSPRNNVYWDPSFVADLDVVSNVSYAHMPLTGRRVDTQWRAGTMSSDFPLLGSRGPRDGIETADSVTCPMGKWSGRVVFADGHVDFLNSTSSFNRRSRFGPDNLFTIDDEEGGSDAILGFTESIDEDGVTLQWD